MFHLFFLFLSKSSFFPGLISSIFFFFLLLEEFNQHDFFTSYGFNIRSISDSWSVGEIFIFREVKELAKIFRSTFLWERQIDSLFKQFIMKIFTVAPLKLIDALIPVLEKLALFFYNYLVADFFLFHLSFRLNWIPLGIFCHV